MMRSDRRAFTLVELLVVIGIISMLIALLLPAVLSGQDRGQAKCQKQLKDQVTAVLQYTMRKNRFPGYADTWTVSDGNVATPGTQEIVVGWVPQVFPYLDMSERLRKLKNWTDVEGDGVPDYLEYIEFFTCPSDPPDLEASMWSESASPDGCGAASPDPAPTISYPLSYAVNAGRADDLAAATPDKREYAVFHDRRGAVTKVNVTLDDLTDGKRETLLITENVDLVSWASNTASWGVSQTHQGVLYSDASLSTTPRLASQAALNDEFIAPFDCDEDGLADNLDNAHARPSSFHQEGFNAAYADGSVDFFFVESSSYPLYVSKMTPAMND